MKLKVCGMKYQDNINQVAELQPDYLGFIFYEKSARFFDERILKVNNCIKKVGVFVNTPLDEVIEKINQYHLQAVQLHGNESPEYCLELKHYYTKQSGMVILSRETNCHSALDAESRIEIIKVFSIKDKFNFKDLKPYEAVCNYFLFDTKGKLPGGNGYSFDWTILNNYPSTKPYFLSGGIGLEDVDKLKAFVDTEVSKHCYAIDVNSKFEIEAGLKNVKLLKEFKKDLSFRSE